MRSVIRRAAMAAGAAVAAVGVAVLASGSAVASAGALAASPASHRWETAEKVPGIGALNKGGYAKITSVSCTSPGNCSAGGYYRFGSQLFQPFVVSQAHGTWGTASKVPGMAPLNKSGVAELFSVSCASAGNCSAGGYYTNRHGEQAFVVSEANGTWGTAIEVPGTAALNRGLAAVTSVSCTSAGNCSAGGFYALNIHGYSQAFVVTQTNGTWGTAIKVPGTGSQNLGNVPSITSVSCASPGNCSAGGSYGVSAQNRQAFVISQTSGTWGKAEVVPGTATLNQGGFAEITSVSCTSAGNCSAGGSYSERTGSQPFVVSEVNGTWHKAIEMPGAVNLGGSAGITSVSCTSAGNCSAGGNYQNPPTQLQTFVVSQVNGTWQTAIEVPGTAALNLGGYAEINSVSCASAGNCSAGGSYTDSAKHIQAFVVNQVNGTWHPASELPGTAALNKGGSAEINSVSCTSVGSCSAGGDYTGGLGRGQAFVDSRT